VLSNLLVDTGGRLTKYRRQTNLNVAILSNAVVATGGLVAWTPKLRPSHRTRGGIVRQRLGAARATAGSAAIRPPQAAASLTARRHTVDRGSAASGIPARFPEAPRAAAPSPECGRHTHNRRAISAEGNAGVQDNSGGAPAAASGHGRHAGRKRAPSPRTAAGRTVRRPAALRWAHAPLSSFSRTSHQELLGHDLRLRADGYSWAMTARSWRARFHASAVLSQTPVGSSAMRCRRGSDVQHGSEPLFL